MKITGKNEELSNFIGKDVFNVVWTNANLEEEKGVTYGNAYVYNGHVNIDIYTSIWDLLKGGYRARSVNASEIENLGAISFWKKQVKFLLISQLAFSKMEVKAKTVKKYWDESTQRGYVKWKKYVFTEEDWQRVLEILPKEQL